MRKSITLKVECELTIGRERERDEPDGGRERPPRNPVDVAGTAALAEKAVKIVDTVTGWLAL